MKQTGFVNSHPLDICPGPDNEYLAAHIQLLSDSLRSLTGRTLIKPASSPVQAARKIFHAPFVVISHTAETDPVLNYVNLAGLELFELTWEKMLGTPSRYTAEAPDREERERLLNRVAIDGYIDDYAGIRISGSGRRFRIKNATVWNLTDHEGVVIGQAATFNNWVFL